jgi:hypothetical protein
MASLPTMTLNLCPTDECPGRTAVVEYAIEPGMPATGDGWHEPRYEATGPEVLVYAVDGEWPGWEFSCLCGETIGRETVARLMAAEIEDGEYGHGIGEHDY